MAAAVNAAAAQPPLPRPAPVLALSEAVPKDVKRGANGGLFYDNGQARTYLKTYQRDQCLADPRVDTSASYRLQGVRSGCPNTRAAAQLARQPVFRNADDAEQLRALRSYMPPIVDEHGQEHVPTAQSDAVYTLDDVRAALREPRQWKRNWRRSRLAARLERARRGQAAPAAAPAPLPALPAAAARPVTRSMSRAAAAAAPQP